MYRKLEIVTLRRGLMAAAALVLGLALFGLGTLPAHAQDDGADYWAEVNIGGSRTVFVPAECVSGVSFDRQSLGAVPDMSETDWNSFQRATIVCDTPLYDLPGGSEIEGEALHQGSSWLVSPTLWPSLSRSALQGDTDQRLEETAPTTESTDATQLTQRADTTRDARLAAPQRWAEVALTPAMPRVYVPAECVAGILIEDTLLWTTSREASIADYEVADDAPGLNELRLATIVCDVGMYTTPGGTQIEGEALLAGQTWFASPYLWTTAPLTTAPATTALDNTLDDATDDATDDAMNGASGS